MGRVTDELVRRWLVWAVNYGEIASYELLDTRRRKWKITIGRDDIHRDNGTPLSSISPLFSAKQLEEDTVPSVLVLTNREALAFGMGCAVAGANKQTRSNYAHKEWGWRA